MSWEDALGWTAERFREIIDRHGPDAVAFYGSGQLDSEAVYMAVKLFKGSIGTNNTDSNSRLCMAAAVAGYRTSLGADGPPPCYADIDLSDCIVVWGSNMAEAHPGHLRPRQGPPQGEPRRRADRRRSAPDEHRRPGHAPRPGRPRRRHPADERRRPAPDRARRGRSGVRRGAHRGLRGLPRLPPRIRLDGDGRGLGRPGRAWSMRWPTGSGGRGRC